MLAKIFRLRLEATAPAAKERSFYSGYTAADLRCCGRLRGHPRRDGGQSRPRGGVLLPPDLPAVPALGSSPEPRATIIARGVATGRGTRPPSRSSRPPGHARSATRRRSTSSGKSGKSQAKSEASSSQASRTRSVHQEPPPSKSSGRANACVAPGKPRGRRQYALRRAAGPAQRPQRERRRAGAQFRPRRQHPRRYLRREARRGVEGERNSGQTSSSSRTSRVQPKHWLRARATRKRSPELARMRRAAMSALAPLLADMKTLIGALTVGAILVGVSALAADGQHLRQPKHDDPERLRMIRECMGMHNKHGGDMP